MVPSKQCTCVVDYPVRRTVAAVDGDKATVEDKAVTVPNAMALQRRKDSTKSSTATAAAGSSMQTAFQMSLTVLSFLAFGGYVISLVTQNMRKPQRNPGMTAPKPLKTVVVNQSRRPLNRPATLVTFGRRRKRNPTFTWTAPAPRGVFFFGFQRVSLRPYIIIPVA